MDIYQFLKDNDISWQRYDHPPVYTCREAECIVPPLPAAKIKNLFLCDKKGNRHFLLVVGAEKSVDLKALSSLLNVNKLRFASLHRMRKYLRVEPGSATLLAVVNDTDREIEVVMDKPIWEEKAFQCHPLVNTSTLVISSKNIRRFLKITGHPAHVIDVPSKDRARSIP